MRISIQILLFICALQQLFSQEKLLNPQSFQDQKLDSKWVYIKYKDGFNSRDTSDNARELSLSKNSLDILKLEVPDGLNPVAFCNKLRQTGEYEYADPIVAYKPLSTPSDALLDKQYYLDNIKAYQAWDITKGDDDITIAIIDSGLDLDHEDISNNLWVNTLDPIDGIDNDENGYVDDYYGYDFADNDADPNIQNGNHGMIVGGIAGASTNNEQGIAGVGYNTKIAALKGFKSSDGSSNGLYEAIIYAADNGIDVLNLSWGRMGDPLQSEQDIINYAVLEKDVVVVAAAGNEGGKSTEEEKWYPASYKNVLSVGASDATDAKSSGSTFNYDVDLVAPGVAMFSTVANNGYGDGGPGTSYAAPQVAAAAALVKEQYPNLSATQIMQRLRSTSDDVSDLLANTSYEGKIGKGRLNVYKAVSESNVKALKVDDFRYSTKHENYLFFGDTISISADLVNYLTPLNSPFTSVSAPSENFIISENSSEIGFLDAMDTTTIFFEIVVNEDVKPETTLDVRFDYSEGAYNDFQYLTLTTSPDRVDFGNDKISMTIAGDGDLALDYSEKGNLGNGFQYQLNTLMMNSGLMLAINDSSVADNIVSDYSNLSSNQDFEVLKNYKLLHHQAADHFGYSEFIDPLHDIIIEQSNLTWEEEDFLIIRYRLINNAETSIEELSLGIFADWDLGDKSTNYAEYDTTDNYIFARNATSDLFAGIQVLGGNDNLYSALDIGSSGENTSDLAELFTDEMKYDFLVNKEKLSAGFLGEGNDIAAINGTTISELGGFDNTYIDIIYAVSNSKEGLASELALAQARLTDFLQKPKVLETFFTCDGASFAIDPEEGINYELYTDPLGQNLLSTGSTLEIENIISDTLFYVRNIDNDYKSEIFEIRIKLFEEIANFELSKDTLYLDHLTNIIQFTDKSIDAVSWNWDFGQGTSSSLQNPSLSFTEIGNYSISLTVESSQGCVNTISKNLVVASRPPSPNIPTINVCPGEDAIINDPTATEIQIYAYEDQVNPSRRGTNLVVPEIERDTIIYISGIYDSFLSERTGLSINVIEVPGSINFFPDTLSSDDRLVLLANEIAEGSSIEWSVNGISEGDSQEISIDAVVGTVTVDLTISSPNGCEKVLQKSIDISTSPFASQSDIVACNGDSIVLKPTNGTYFGFYEDPELVSLIKKGTQLKTNSFSKVYISGLDDGLPGMPIEVNIQNESPEIEIAFTAKPIGDKQQVNLNTESTSEIMVFEWFLNGEYIESVATPTIFVNNGPNEITLQTTSSFGCISQDTLILDFTPPLSASDELQFRIYPNPTKGMIEFGMQKVEKIDVIQLNGRLIDSIEVFNNSIDLSYLNKGMYLVKCYVKNKTFTRHVILR